MKLTVQYYDKDPKAAKGAVKAVLDKSNLVAEDRRPDFQTVEIADVAASKVLIAALSPIANIQTQTEN